VAGGGVAGAFFAAGTFFAAGGAADFFAADFLVAFLAVLFFAAALRGVPSGWLVIVVLREWNEVIRRA
jgi:hypothetical protein